MKRLLLLSLFLSGLCAAIRADAKTNFVVFISDDQSLLDSQAYGSTEVRTPNMLRLAADALKFPSLLAHRQNLVPMLYHGEPLLHSKPVTLIAPGAKRN